MESDHKVRVFHNACRHRGVSVLLKSLKKDDRSVYAVATMPGAIRSEGKLKQTPHVGGPEYSRTQGCKQGSKLGLIEVRSHIFMDVVFVNLSGDAKPFEEVYKSALERWKEFDQPLYHGGEDSSFKLQNLKTNWKLAVENFCEAYHVPFIHPGLNEISKLEDHENLMGDGPWGGQLTRAFNASYDEDGRNFAFFKNLSKKWDSEAEYICFYPNVQIGVHKDHTFAIVMEPKGPGKPTNTLKFTILTLPCGMKNGQICVKPMLRCGKKFSLKMWVLLKQCTTAEKHQALTAGISRR